VQLAPAARLPVQVFAVRLNWVLLTESEGVLADTPDELVMVTVCGALGWPGLCGAKVSCGGLTLSPVVTCPEPLNCALTAVVLAEEIVSVAALPPAANGVKMTCTVQLPPAASVVPLAVGQVFAPKEK
jgi:hypothetical protein